LNIIYKEYTVFKRKFRSYQANYHKATPPRELVQMFREMCLPDKIAMHNKKVETMTPAWLMLDAFYDVPLAFVKDLQSYPSGK
jgi:hypothetical protein